MGKGNNYLTDLECRNAKPRADGKALILPDGDGLRLVVKPHGAKEWQMRFTVAAADQGPRKESALSLGQYPAVGLQPHHGRVWLVLPTKRYDRGYLR